jgi:hypothetical protein
VKFSAGSRSLLRNTLLLIAVLGTSASPASSESCKKLPGSSVSSTGETYKISAVRWDPLLQQRWGVFISCESPWQPPRLLRMDDPRTQLESRASTKPSAAVVHAGDLLHVQRTENDVRMEFVGVADEIGALGQRIRIHLSRPHEGMLGASTDGGWNPQLTAVILGPHEAEVWP